MEPPLLRALFCKFQSLRPPPTLLSPGSLGPPYAESRSDSRSQLLCVPSLRARGPVLPVFQCLKGVSSSLCSFPVVYDRSCPVLEVAYGSLVSNTYFDFNERMAYFFHVSKNNLKSKHSIYLL